MVPAMEEYRKVSDRLARVFEKEIVFVVGATCWGTAWVQQFLDAHPEVLCKGEGHFTDSLFPMLARVFDDYNADSDVVGNRLQKAGLSGNAAGFTFDDVHHVMTTAVGLVLDRWTDSDGGRAAVRVIAEKTPEHVVSLDLLARVVPTLKVVHVYRDGRDEALSAWDFNRGLSRGEFQEKFPEFKDFDETFSANWIARVTAARRFERDHPGRCFHFRCDDLQGDAVEALGPLLTFLGVGVNEAQIKDAAVRAWEALPLDVDPGAWKQKFDDKPAEKFRRDCGELLKLLGYEP
jgi:hypothetical protein